MSSPFRAMIFHGVPVQTDPHALLQNIASPVKTGCGFHDVREILRSAGLRPTRQRVMLGWLLFGRGHRHLTAEMLYDEAIGAKISVSLATVYNTLHQFREAGLLRQLAVDGTKSYFDTNMTEHHHFFMEDDQTLVDIPDGQISVAGIPVAPEGMEVVSVEVIVRLKRKGIRPPTHRCIMSHLYKVTRRFRWGVSFGIAGFLVLGATLSPHAQSSQKARQVAPEVKTVAPQGEDFLPPRPHAGDVMRHWPAYPDEARAAGQEGTVLVKLRVTATGAPEDISVARSSSVVSLDLAAVMAISHWRFEPATRNGKPVEATVTLPIRFSL